MTTKGPLRKQIIPIAKLNAELIINLASSNITNINKCLKNTKSDIIADFIHLTNNGVIITTNKPANMSNLLIIKKYMKNINNINLDNIDCPYLPKSKLYLKIIGLPHNMENGVLTLEVIEGVLKDSHLFKNVVLASKPQVIKPFPKSDMAVVWVDLWDSQSSSSVKNIINCYFNVGQYIITIRGTNMNLGVPQCKNCWKWGHLTLSCHSHVSRCTKCYGAHSTKHHREKVWCCTKNKKLNCVATKVSEPCPHIFKCMNCKEDYQANSYSCPYWHNHFNRSWHDRKSQKLFQK